MNEFTEKSSAVYPGLVLIEEQKEMSADKSEFWKYWRGVVEHKLGVVQFTQSLYQSTGKNNRWLRLTAILDGVEFARDWDAFYGKKTIARLANEFIEEVKGGDQQ